MAAGKQIFISALVLLGALGFLALGYELPGKGRDVPVLVGWIAVGLCVLDVVAQTPTAAGRWIAALLSGSASGEPEDEPRGLSLELKSFFWVLVACAGVIVFGFLWAVPVYVFAYMTLHGRKPVVQSGLTALGATAFLWIAFELLLEYEIYRGLLFSDL
ncbi:MAG: hypothetical protein GEU92_02605 [Alphaproteobacteria bacterium]|nr:hypothetical protein [Alphaproteobacteria bacterium]